MLPILLAFVLAWMEGHPNPHEVCTHAAFHDIAETRASDLDYQERIKRVLDGDYQLDPRSLVRIECNNGDGSSYVEDALNDEY